MIVSRCLRNVGTLPVFVECRDSSDAVTPQNNWLALFDGKQVGEANRYPATTGSTVLLNSSDALTELGKVTASTELRILRQFLLTLKSKKLCLSKVLNQ